MHGLGQVLQLEQKMSEIILCGVGTQKLDPRRMSMDTSGLVTD